MFRISDDRNHHLPHALQRALWATCGAVVLLFIFLAALGAFEPRDVLPATVAAVVLAALWLGHEWRRLWREERGKD